MSLGNYGRIGLLFAGLVALSPGGSSARAEEDCKNGNIIYAYNGKWGNVYRVDTAKKEVIDVRKAELSQEKNLFDTRYGCVSNVPRTLGIPGVIEKPDINCKVDPAMMCELYKAHGFDKALTEKEIAAEVVKSTAASAGVVDAAMPWVPPVEVVDVSSKNAGVTYSPVLSTSTANVTSSTVTASSPIVAKTGPTNFYSPVGISLRNPNFLYKEEGSKATVRAEMGSNTNGYNARGLGVVGSDKFGLSAEVTGKTVDDNSKNREHSARVDYSALTKDGSLIHLTGVYGWANRSAVTTTASNRTEQETNRQSNVMGAEITQGGWSLQGQLYRGQVEDVTDVDVTGLSTRVKSTTKSRETRALAALTVPVVGIDVGGYCKYLESKASSQTDMFSNQVFRRRMTLNGDVFKTYQGGVSLSVPRGISGVVYPYFETFTVQGNGVRDHANYAGVIDFETAVLQFALNGSYQGATGSAGGTIGKTARRGNFDNQKRIFDMNKDVSVQDVKEGERENMRYFSRNSTWAVGASAVQQAKGVRGWKGFVTATIRKVLGGGLSLTLYEEDGRLYKERGGIAQVALGDWNVDLTLGTEKTIDNTNKYCTIGLSKSFGGPVSSTERKSGK